MAVEIVLARRALLALIIIIIGSMAGLYAFVYLPAATIHIHPATNNHTVSQLIILSSSAQGPDFAHFILPAQVVSKEAEQTQTIARTDAATQDDFAQGTITLHNDQLEPQSLLPKTHLKYEATGAYFLTDTPITIPPQGEVPIHITAQDKGSAGNVPPGKFIIDKLAASLQTHIYGTSDVPMSGGTIVQSPLSQAEIDQAKQTVVSTLKDQVMGAITAAAGGAHIRPELLSVQSEADDVSADVGSKTSIFTVHEKIKATGFIVDENDLLGLTLLSLRSKPQPEQDFVSYDPASFQINIGLANFDKGEAQIKCTLTGTFANKVNLSNIRPQDLAGLSSSEIQDVLKKDPGIGSVDVSFSPFWVKTAPSRPEAITTVVETNNSQSGQQ